MPSNESLIVHERGDYFVMKVGKQYTVYKTGHVHAMADSSYPLTDDGKSIAIARCDYLANRPKVN